MRAAYTGTEALTFSQYIDLDTGKTLTAEPGGVYDIAPASGHVVDDVPAPWFTAAEPNALVAAPAGMTAERGLTRAGPEPTSRPTLSNRKTQRASTPPHHPSRTNRVTPSSAPERMKGGVWLLAARTSIPAYSPGWGSRVNLPSGRRWSRSSRIR